MTFSLYIHIPFCEVKCGYCDFFSVPRGYEDFSLQEQYVKELIREIELRSQEAPRRDIDTLFFGGGTPSLLDPPLLEKIFQALKSYFSWNEKTEITLETNPKTVSLEKLKSFRSLGINRLSIGVQSFQDRFLKSMGRIHSGEEAKKTIREAREAGFENISMDLIFALPGQTFQDWQQDLEEAIRLETPHLSAYHLTIESGTTFETLYRKGKLKLPSEEDGVHCLTWTRERLCQVDMGAYEISNFARPGFECRHNQNYWQYGEYLGFGAGAASFAKTSFLDVSLRGVKRRSNLPQKLDFQGDRHASFHSARDDKREHFAIRQANIRDLKKYLSGQWNGFSEDINLKMAMGEFCMLGLRTREGMVKENFFREFGLKLEEVYSETLDRWIQKGWLKAYSEGWQLTPNGLLFENDVSASFLK